MNNSEYTTSAIGQRQRLLVLCRFLSARICYRFMPVLLAGTGLVLSLLGQSQFAPYGIALVCLILPSFLTGSSSETTKKENSDIPLSGLYRRYHFSPSVFTAYRISLLLCILLLLAWHMIQSVPVTVFGISIALLYLATTFALYPLLSHILFAVFHHRLMHGRL